MKAFNWNHENNQQLMEERSISFEDVLFYIQHGQLLDDIEHPNRVGLTHPELVEG